MIKVEYRIIPQFMDEITFDTRHEFDVLLINKQGLYYLFHPSQILNVLNYCKDSGDDFKSFQLIDARQIPTDIARIFTGE